MPETKRSCVLAWLLYFLFLLNFVFPVFGAGGTAIQLPNLPLSLSSDPGNYGWNIYNVSGNCNGVSNITTQTNHTAGTTDILRFYGWNTTSISDYINVTTVLFSLQYTVNDPNCYGERTAVLVDRCGAKYFQDAVSTNSGGVIYESRWSWDFTTAVSANLFKTNNVSIEFQVDISGGSSCVWATNCAKMSIFVLGVDPNSSTIHPCTAPSPSTSPTPSPTPLITPSVSPSATPAASSSPVSSSASASPSVSSSPSPSASPSSSTATSSNSSPSSDPASSSSPTHRKGSTGSNSGTIIGAVVGAVAGVAALGLLAFLLIARRKKRQQQKSNNAEENSSQGGLQMTEQKSSSKPSDTQKDSQIGLAVASTNNSKSSLAAELYIDDVKLKGMLGKGKFGEVYEGLWHGTTAVACKKLKNDDKEEFENEIQLLMKLNHPNVVRCLGIWKNPSNGEIFMILELLRLGSLTNFLRSADAQKKLAVADLIEMCVHAASGMVFLEQKNIVHRDLGARNLLVSETDGRYVVKISDFGLSRQVEENDAIYSSKEGVFPVKWSPPEVINYRKFTSKSDVWSFGITMWEIFEYGKVPYPTMTNEDAIAKVMQGYRLPKPETCPDQVYQLMLQCWNVHVEERPNFKSIHNQLQQVLKSIRGEDEEFKYQAEDAEKNYNKPYDSYNNNGGATYNTGSSTYNNGRQETYNSGNLYNNK